MGHPTVQSRPDVFPFHQPLCIRLLHPLQSSSEPADIVLAKQPEARPHAIPDKGNARFDRLDEELEVIQILDDLQFTLLEFLPAHSTAHKRSAFLKL
jgi:hypothetical protein